MSDSRKTDVVYPNHIAVYSAVVAEFYQTDEVLHNLFAVYSAVAAVDFVDADVVRSHSTAAYSTMED